MSIPSDRFKLEYFGDGAEGKYLLALDSFHSLLVYDYASCPKDEEVSAVAAKSLPRYVLIKANVQLGGEVQENLPLWVRVKDLTEELGERYPLKELQKDTPEERATKIYRCIHLADEEPARAGCGEAFAYDRGFEDLAVLSPLDTGYTAHMDLASAAKEVLFLEDSLKKIEEEYTKEGHIKLPSSFKKLLQVQAELAECIGRAKHCLQELRYHYDHVATSDTQVYIQSLIDKANSCHERLETLHKTAGDKAEIIHAKNDIEVVEKLLMVLDEKYTRDGIVKLPSMASELATLKQKVSENYARIEARLFSLQDLSTKRRISDKRYKKLKALYERAVINKEKLEVWLNFVSVEVEMVNAEVKLMATRDFVVHFHKKYALTDREGKSSLMLPSTSAEQLVLRNTLIEHLQLAQACHRQLLHVSRLTRLDPVKADSIALQKEVESYIKDLKAWLKKVPDESAVLVSHEIGESAEKIAALESFLRKVEGQFRCCHPPSVNSPC